jgi:hypothetical protein
MMVTLTGFALLDDRHLLPTVGDVCERTHTR